MREKPGEVLEVMEGADRKEHSTVHHRNQLVGAEGQLQLELAPSLESEEVLRKERSPAFFRGATLACHNGRCSPAIALLAAF